MLQTIRERAQGWIAWAIVILISIPFALWGIQSYMGVGGEPIAAKVNGTEIPAREVDRRLQETRIQLRERLGEAYDPSLFEDRRLREEVLEGMIRDTLLLDATRRLGMRVSDQEVQLQILSEPAFQQDGRFDQESYKRLLQFQGLSPAMFEAQLRQQLATSQLLRLVSGTELVTTAELADYQRLQDQQRAFEYLLFPVADGAVDASADEPRQGAENKDAANLGTAIEEAQAADSAVETADAAIEGMQTAASLIADPQTAETGIADAEIASFYEAHQDRFASPEQVKLEYLVLDSLELAKAKVAVTEEELRARYEAELPRFQQPERRAARHLLLKTPSTEDAAATEAVRKQILALRERILAGESFAELAKKESADPGSAANGGDLGVIERGIMVPEFDAEVFRLPVGELSEPIRTQFGYHLIEVTEILPAATQPLDTVRDQLRQEIVKQRADALYYDLGERLATLVYESADSLEPAAAELGLEIQRSDWISRESGGEGLLADPRVLRAAFSDTLLREGNNSDMIEPEGEQLRALVLRVVEHREASIKPLAEVRDEIVGLLRAERARSAAMAAAEKAAELLRQGQSWSAAVADREPQRTGLVGREAAEIPRPLLDEAFKLPAPAGGAVSVAVVTLDDGSAAVVRLTEVQDGKPSAPTPDAKSETAAPRPDALMLTRLIARQAYASMVEDMESRAKIERQSETPEMPAE